MKASRTSLGAWLRRSAHAVVLSSLGVMAAGCGASRPVKYYALDPGSSRGPETTTTSAQFPITLLVARMTSSHLYRDDRLVYRSGPGQIGTYEYHRWAERPVEMVQDSLVASLRATNQYRSVSSVGSSVRGEYILRGRLSSLDEVDKPAIAARFSIELELFDPAAGATIWTDSYSQEEPVTGKTVPDVVEALDRIVRTGVQQLTANLSQYFANHPPQALLSR